MNVRKIEGFQWLEDELVVVVPAEHRLAGSAQVALRTWFMSAGYLEKGSEQKKRLRKCSCPVA